LALLTYYQIQYSAFATFT